MMLNVILLLYIIFVVFFLGMHQILWLKNVYRLVLGLLGQYPIPINCCTYNFQLYQCNLFRYYLESAV